MSWGFLYSLKKSRLEPSVKQVSTFSSIPELCTVCQDSYPLDRVCVGYILIISLRIKVSPTRKEGEAFVKRDT